MKEATQTGVQTTKEELIDLFGDISGQIDKNEDMPEAMKRFKKSERTLQRWMVGEFGESNIGVAIDLYNFWVDRIRERASKLKSVA